MLVDACGFLWLFTLGSYEFLWMFIDSFGSYGCFMNSYGCLMYSYGCSWLMLRAEKNKEAFVRHCTPAVISDRLHTTKCGQIGIEEDKAAN